MPEESILLPSYFRLAKNVSVHSNYRIRMGAVIVKHGRPISVGFNKIKSHPKWSYANLETIHAEASAIMSAGRTDLKGSSIFVYRERKKNKQPAMAKPCKNCMKLLKDFGIKWVYYSTNEYPFWEVTKI